MCKRILKNALQNSDDADMVGLFFRNENEKNKQKDKSIGFLSFGRKYQIYTEAIWKLFDKVAQSNERYNALDPLIVIVHSVKMPVCFSGDGLKSKDRQIDDLEHLKRSIVRNA
jgi:hypothetical protein